MKKEKAKIFKTLIILTIIILIILVGLVLILLSKEKENAESENLEVYLQNSRQIEKSVIMNKLANMEERERIEYYFSRFMAAVESSDYEKAYNMLYSKFKENYFPDLNSFEIYMKKTFSKFSSVKHENFERSGENYILYITITNTLSTDSKGREMTFVVKENGLNDYVMSFSVI